jgi:hypothetical protein
MPMPIHLRSTSPSTWFLRAMLASLGASLLAACGGSSPGTLGGASVVHDYTADARPKPQCGSTRPLVVDWASSDRAQLEAQAHKGLVAVRYDGCDMKVLTRCVVKQSPAYEYIALTPKTDQVDIRDAVEMYANVPVYAARLEGKLAQSGSLHTNMTIVGQLDTSRPVPRKDELEGDCDEATHVVTALTVGAFEFFAGTSSEAGAEASVAGVGAGAKAASSKEMLNKDGDAARCAALTDADTKPPSGCGALLRIEVVPLGAARPTEPTCSASTQWDGDHCVAVKKDVSCPAGQVADKVKGCIEKKPDIVAQAKALVLVKAGKISASGSTRGVAPVQADCTDVDACQKSCDADEARGCLGLAGLLRAGLKPGKPEPQGDQAAAAFKKACDKGESSACVALGELYYQGLGVAKDAAAAPPLFEKACDAGDPVGCNDMGHALSDGAIPRDSARAAAFYGRACNSKSSLGCFGLGLMLRDGRGVARDAAKAKALFKKACQGGVAAACKLAAN